MTLTELKESVELTITMAKDKGYDPDDLPVVGLNMNGEYRTDFCWVGLRLEETDPDEHFDDSEWAPGPCATVQVES